MLFNDMIIGGQEISVKNVNFFQELRVIPDILGITRNS